MPDTADEDLCKPLFLSQIPDQFTMIADSIGVVAGLAMAAADKVVKIDGREVSRLAEKESYMRGLGACMGSSPAGVIQDAIAGESGTMVSITVRRNGRLVKFDIPRGYNLTVQRFKGLVF